MINTQINRCSGIIFSPVGFYITSKKTLYRFTTSRMQGNRSPIFRRYITGYIKGTNSIIPGLDCIAVPTGIYALCIQGIAVVSSHRDNIGITI